MTTAPFPLIEGGKEAYDGLVAAAIKEGPYVEYIKYLVDGIASGTEAAINEGMDSMTAMRIVADSVASTRPQLSEIIAMCKSDAVESELEIDTPTSFGDLRTYTCGLVVRELACTWTRGAEFNHFAQTIASDLPDYSRA